MTDEKSSPITPAMRGVIFCALGLLVAVAVAALLTGGGPSSSVGASPSGSASLTAGPSHGATPTSGSEVMAPGAGPEASLSPIPPPATSAPATPVLVPPYPASATADFAMVDGFPEQLMGPAPSSDILQSAIATEGDVMQVTLVGRTDASPDVVRAVYAQRWATLGLTNASTAADGSLTYSGAFESLSVSAIVGGTGTRYTIFGVFRAS